MKNTRSNSEKAENATKSMETAKKRSLVELVQQSVEKFNSSRQTKESSGEESA